MQARGIMAMSHRYQVTVGRPGGPVKVIGLYHSRQDAVWAAVLHGRARPTLGYLDIRLEYRDGTVLAYLGPTA